MLILVLAGRETLRGQDSTTIRAAVARGERALLDGTSEVLRASLQASLDGGSATASDHAALAAASFEPAQRLEHLQQARELAPKLDLLKGLVAQQLYALGRPDEARQALTGVPEASLEPEVVIARARQRVQLGYPDSARDYLEWAVSATKEPAIITEYMLLGRKAIPREMDRREWAREQERYDELYELVTRRTDDSPMLIWGRDARLNGGWTPTGRYGFSSRFWGGSDPEAARLLNEAIGGCPKDLETNYEFAMALWRMAGWGAKAGQFQRILDSFRTAYALRPRRTDVALWRGFHELLSYAGDPVAGNRLLSGLPATPDSYAGPVLLELVSLGRGLFAYFVGSHRAAARELLKTAHHEGWGVGLMLADSLAAAGNPEGALEIAEAWSVSTRAQSKACQSEAEKLREYLDAWGFGPFKPAQAEHLADAWYVGAYDRAPGGPNQTISRWLQGMRREGRQDWIEQLFTGHMGILADKRELEKIEKGSTEDLPEPEVVRTRERPVAGTLMDGLRAAAAAEWNKGQADAPSGKSLNIGAFVLAIGVSFIYAATRIPRDAPLMVHLPAWSTALLVTLVGVWFVSPASWRRPVRARVIPILEARRASKAAARDPEPVPVLAGNYTPAKALAKLLADAAVPAAQVPPPDSLTALLEAAADSRTADGLLKTFRELSAEARKQQLAAAGEAAYPYLMQKLARGTCFTQELAAGYLAVLGDERSLPLLRYVAHEHIARAMRHLLDGLPLFTLTHVSESDYDMGHDGNCHVLDALAAAGDPKAVPLLLDALESADTDMLASAQRGLTRMTRAVGLRTAFQWRTALASPAFGKQPD
ncbi:MAG: hypothetical protein HYY25_05000 [Candidatus Wallbacteria bacterium]|nr:hypothetical protein [Candidatus Wallbacteria bacterium]